MCGEFMSIADFYSGNCYVSILANPDFYEPERRAQTLERYPKFTKFGEKFRNDLSNYLNNRKPYPA